ncbi:hypothetical protein L1049_025302 [Liquidambar formosana]|uniref:Uncharacterized protein n=1 Tax=Liquidambar formosana TaxID=63359 RepID=A0AAP0N328_LIQFO
MLSLKLVRSLVLGETINNPFLPTQNHHDHDHDDTNNTSSSAHAHDPARPTRNRGKINTDTNKRSKTKTPILLFMPTKELVTDTHRLATIARDMGMDLHPTPSLSHIILSYPSSSPSPSPSSSLPSSWSSSSLSSSWLLPNGAIPLPFPSLTTACVSHLRSFVNLSKGLFKLVFVKLHNYNPNGENGDNLSNWDCCSLSLFSRLTGDRIDTMDGFSRALAGKGWTLFKTKDNPLPHSGDCRVHGGKSVYLFRKVDSSRIRARLANGSSATSGECRIRELRLPTLDFRNAPLRILQYILLMTDDIFYLA